MLTLLKFWVPVGMAAAAAVVAVACLVLKDWPRTAFWIGAAMVNVSTVFIR